jgi:anti-sigma regulatory factor (Ser/Thr protein kinase)
MQADMTQRGLPVDFIDDAALVLTELISNALRHARPLADGGVRAEWRFSGRALEVTVTDGGSTRQPHVTFASEDTLGGRGLAIVSALSAEWGVGHARRDGEGKRVDECTVWARLVLTPDAPATEHRQGFTGGDRVLSETQSGTEFADEFARQVRGHLDDAQPSDEPPTS